MSERRVPMRRCVGCMTSFPKNEVVRLVMDGKSLALDTSGKKNGRGAYLCRSLDCFDTAVKKRRFAYALGVTMTQEEYDILRNEYTKVISDAEVCE